MGKVNVIIEHAGMSSDDLYHAILDEGLVSEEVMADYFGEQIRVYVVPDDEDERRLG